MEIDKKIIKKLIDTLEDLKKSLKNIDAVSNLQSEETEIDDNKIIIKSPIVGTAYLSPEPGAKPFVSIGKKIKKGETLLIVEAMKTMNPIKAPHGGQVSQILVENGAPVEFGELLVIID